MPQQDGLALHLRQRLQRIEEGGPLLDGQAAGLGSVVPVEPGPLAAPRPPALVDVGAHDDPPHVGVRLDVRAQPGPSQVELGQRRLQYVVRAVPVAADRIGDPAQVRLTRGDVLDVRRVPIVRRSGHRSPSPEAA